MVCPGCEGHLYKSKTGFFERIKKSSIVKLINRENQVESSRIWNLIDPDYKPIDWQIDFKSGYRWREKTRYDQILYAPLQGVDIKVPWELSRMQHLATLAWAYGLSKNGVPGFASPDVYFRDFRNQNTVRYYGYYSNKSRGMRKKAQLDDQIPTVAPGQMSAKQFRQNWARLIQKIYEVDPLICPKCLGDMHIVAFIDQAPVIEKILRCLELWHTHNHAPPTRPTVQQPNLAMMIPFPKYRLMRMLFDAI